ncbi:4-oxalocrotonate tautomerase family protein [Kribbella sp. NBC_01510]
MRLVRGRGGDWNGLNSPTERKEHPMPVVTVLQGPRTPELKRELVQRITDAFVDSLGVPAQSVQVWIQETPPESWAVGGTLTADK